MKKNLKIASIALGLSALVSLGLGVSGLTATAQSAAVSSFEVLNAAAIRKSAPEGVRFTARISKAQRTEGQSFGMLIMPTASFEGELTVDTENVLDIPAQTWVSESVYEDYGFSADYDYFNAVIAGEDDGNGNIVFPEQYYNLLLTARGYVTDGTTVEYTETVSTRSIAYVAKMAQMAGEEDLTGVIAKIAEKAEIGFAKESVTLMVGGTEELKLYVGGVAVEESDKVSVSYASDNNGVVSVNDNGELTAKKRGTANVSVTVTVDGGETLVKTTEVTVNPPEIVDYDTSLVQKGYDSLFTTGASTTIDYVENEVVGEKTIAKAIKVHSDKTSWGSGDAINAGHSFVLAGSVLKAAAEKGYTNLAITFYTLAGVRAYNGATTNNSYPFYTNFGYTEYTEVTKTVDLATMGTNNLILVYFHNYDKTVYDGTQDVDTYITEMYFCGKTDFDGDYISLNDMGTLTMGKNTTISYLENVTLGGKVYDEVYRVHSDTTSYGSGTIYSAGHYFNLPAKIIKAAVENGYTQLKISYYSLAGLRGYISYVTNGAAIMDDAFNRIEYATVDKTVDLSKLISGGNYVDFAVGYFHNYNQSVYDGTQATDIYITEMVFTGKATGDLVTLNNLYDLTATGASVSYEANANIGDKMMKAFRIHATSTAAGSAGAPKFTIAASLFAKAAASEFTHVRITIYTKCGYKLYSDNAGAPQSMQGGTETVAKSSTVELDVTKYTSSGMNVIFYHNVDFGTDVPCDVYVTALEFIKK